LEPERPADDLVVLSKEVYRLGWSVNSLEARVQQLRQRRADEKPAVLPPIAPASKEKMPWLGIPVVPRDDAEGPRVETKKMPEPKGPPAVGDPNPKTPETVPFEKLQGAAAPEVEERLPGRPPLFGDDPLPKVEERHPDFPLFQGPVPPRAPKPFTPIDGPAVARPQDVPPLDQQRLDEIRQLRFPALYKVRVGEGRGDGKTYYGECTIAGPVLENRREIKGHVNLLAVDPRGPTYFTECVEVLDPETGKGESIDFRDQEGKPAISRACGLTFDGKRNRLVAAHLYGKGHMYAYYPENKQWKSLRDMEDVDLLALCYSAKEDVLYGLAFEYGAGPRLYQYSPEGQILKQTRVAAAASVIPERPGDMQMMSVGDYLIVVGSPGFPFEAKDPAVRVIDPRTSAVVYSGQLSTPVQDQGADPMPAGPHWNEPPMPPRAPMEHKDFGERKAFIPPEPPRDALPPPRVGPPDEIAQLIAEVRAVRQQVDRLAERAEAIASRPAVAAPAKRSLNEDPKNLIRNGGFERPDVGRGWHDIGPGGGDFVWNVGSAGEPGDWRVELVDGDWSGVSEHGTPNASDQSVDIDFHTILSQQIAVQPGKTYEFSFSYAHNPDWGNRSSTGTARVVGQKASLYQVELKHEEDSTLQDMKFKRNRARFVADGATARVEFEGTTRSALGFAVDDVRVALVEDAGPDKGELPKIPQR
jgi:hypothetical protein